MATDDLTPTERKKIALYNLEFSDDPEAIQIAKNTLRELAKSSKRPLVQLMAAKEILNHQRDIYKHENPAIQKSEVNHNFPTGIKLVLGE